MTHSLPAALAAFSWLAACLPAQVQPAAPLPPLRTPIHTAAADQGHAYGLWAVGHDYKVSFHDGMQFVPYLGRDYPTTVSFGWRTESVRIGAQELVTQAPKLRHSDWRAEYDLGAVVEAYDVRGEGLEQTFVVRAPVGDGDLVVRGVVRSPLRTAPVPSAHQPLPFADAEGRALVTYGAATAVDAKGRRMAMTTTCDGERIELRLAGAWLRDAAFPVVVDPLLTPTTLLVSGPMTGLDVLHETYSNPLGTWLAYARAVSQADDDLFLRRANDDGSGSFLVYQDVSGSWSSAEPALSFVRGPDAVVVAFTRHFASGNRSVRWHRHQRDDQTLSTSVGTVATPAGSHLWRPDLGGRRFATGGDSMLLVCQREDTGGAFGNTSTSAVYGCLLDMNGNGSAGPLFAIAEGQFLDAERPALNQLRDVADAGSWLLAWQQANTLAVGGGNTTWDVVARVVAGDGTLGASLVVDAAGTEQRHEMAPVVAGGREPYLVAMTASTLAQRPVRPSAAEGHQVRIAMLQTGAPAAAPSQPHPTDVEVTYPDPRATVIGAAQDLDSNDHWAVAYHSTATQRIYFTTVGYRGQRIQSVEMLAPTGADTSFGRGMSFDSRNDVYQVSFTSTSAVSGNTSLRLGRFQLPTLPPEVVDGIGCSTAAITWFGRARIGAGSGGVLVSNLPAGALSVVMVGLQPVAQPLVGVPGVQNGCWLLVPNAGPGHLATLPFFVGDSAFQPIPLPETLTPLTLHFQAFHTDASLSLLSSTQRLTIDFAY